MTNHDTALELTDIVFPEHANHYGTLFGGNALLLMSRRPSWPHGPSPAPTW